MSIARCMLVFLSAVARAVMRWARGRLSADIVTLGAEDATATNRVVGHIRAEEFIGSVITVFLELADGSVFRVQKQQHEIARLQAQFGSRLSARWDSESTYLLPE